MLRKLLQENPTLTANVEDHTSENRRCQYLAKQLQLLSSKYPGREIKTAHMVSFGLRPHVIAAWNSHSYKESVITGIEAKELVAENWLRLNNSTVHHILLEAARPRTKELYARELILFLGKSIPQSLSV